MGPKIPEPDDALDLESARPAAVGAEGWRFKPRTVGRPAPLTPAPSQFCWWLDVYTTGIGRLYTSGLYSLREPTLSPCWLPAPSRLGGTLQVRTLCWSSSVGRFTFRFSVPATPDSPESPSLQAGCDGLRRREWQACAPSRGPGGSLSSLSSGLCHSTQVLTLSC